MTPLNGLLVKWTPSGAGGHGFAISQYEHKFNPGSGD